MKKLFFILSISAMLFSCEKEEDLNTPTKECQKDASNRRGAECNDGTTTTATGSGACSGHGGVKVWLCKD